MRDIAMQIRKNRARSILLAVFCVSLFHLSTALGSTLLRGENRTCRDYADLDKALDHPNTAYFRGWTSADFDAAQMWVTSCFASPPTKQDVERQSLLAQRRNAMSASGEIQRNDEALRIMEETRDRDQREREAQQQAEEAAQVASEAAQRAEEAKAIAGQKARQAAHDACMRSSPYQMYLAEAHIVEALDRESAAQQALEHERRVEEVSGTTNLYAKRLAGESLVGAQDEVTKWWGVYQRNGGDAKTAQTVSRSTADPCKW
jgi:hypothetical protein